jgi:hypothetical protein
MGGCSSASRSATAATACIFPASFIVNLSPAALQIREAFNK